MSSTPGVRNGRIEPPAVVRLAGVAVWLAVVGLCWSPAWSQERVVVEQGSPLTYLANTTDPTLATSQGIVSAGNITADGGDADPTVGGSIGGDAGDFWLFAPQGPASVSYAILSAKGGAGETEGADGEIIAGGYTIAP